MKANIMEKVIEMTKSEAKAAGILGSKKFNELKEYRIAYPEYEIKVMATSKAKDNMKGLTISYMKSYIQGHENEEKDRMATFNQLRGLDPDGKEEVAPSASYGELKMWFLSEYPAFEKFGEDVDKILNEAKKKRAAQRAAAKAA